MIATMSPRLLLRNALWIGFGARLVFAVWNGFWGPSVGAFGDASGLHELAANIADGVFPDRFRIGISYAYVLGAVYWLTGPSTFLGSLLSCFAWLVSALVLVASFRELRAPVVLCARGLMIYGLVPSSVMWTSVTMREPYQLLCVNMAMYAALRILAGAQRYWFLLLAAMAGGALLHAVLLGWGLCLVAAVIALLVYERVGPSPMKLSLATVGGVVLMFIGFKLFTQLYSYPVERGLAFAVNSYQQGGLSIGVRTDYRASVNIETNLELLIFLPTALLQYLFEPMPWRLTSVLDLVPFSENLLRLGLIAQAAWLCRVSARSQRGLIVFLLGAYFVLELGWAVGTFNWGTAARHHIPTLGLLLLAAFADSRPARSDRTQSHEPVVTAA